MPPAYREAARGTGRPRMFLERSFGMMTTGMQKLAFPNEGCDGPFSQVPRRDGRPLGATLFANMTAAYDALPDDVKREIEGLSATHNFEKFWEMMRQRGGAKTSRAPMTEEQKRMKTTRLAPDGTVHPISGPKSLYADLGYAVSIDGMDKQESDELLDFLSGISCGRNSNTRIVGTRATSWCGTICARCTMPKRIMRR